MKSSVGRKAVVAVTGLLLVGFVVAHMLGNLQIFMGQEQLNWYAHKLQSTPLLLWPARFFLLAVVVLHIFFSIQLAIENKKARPISYAVKDTVQASLASRTMVVSGILLTFFIIYHLLHFTFGLTHPEIFHLVDAKGRHDVYAISVLSFQNWLLSGAYVVAMFFLCFHLSHGLASFPQSLGLNNDKYQPCLKRMAKAVSAIIFIGNSSIPLSVFFGFVK